jgi:hypothetical protein
MRPTIRSLFEPHYKQSLYANPKRTAKFLLAPYLYDTTEALLVQIIFVREQQILEAHPTCRRADTGSHDRNRAALHLTTTGSRQT